MTYSVMRIRRKIKGTGIDFAELFRTKPVKGPVKMVSSNEHALKLYLARDFPFLELDKMKDLVREILLKAMSMKDEDEADNENEELAYYWWQGKCPIPPLRYKVHQVSLAKYDGGEDKSTLTFEVSFYYKIIRREYEDKAAFIFTFSLLDDDLKYIFTCDNCGAPIESHRVRVCPYCKTGYLVSVLYGWKLTGIL